MSDSYTDHFRGLEFADEGTLLGTSELQCLEAGSLVPVLARREFAHASRTFQHRDIRPVCVNV